MSLEGSSCWRNALTMVTRVSYTFVLCFFMFLKVTDPCSSIFTQVARVARVFYTFVFGFLVKLQALYPGSIRLTFIKLIFRFLWCNNRWCWSIWFSRFSLNNKRVHGWTANFHNKWLFIKKIISLIKISYKIEEKWEKFISFFWMGKNIIWKLSERALIGQNDSLDVLQLDEFFLRFIKGRNDPTQTFGG